MKITIERNIILMVGIIVIGFILSLTYAYIVSAFPVSESSLIIIANLETQLSGTLIGFMAIGLFYYLGVVHRIRDRFSRIQDTIFRTDVARLRGKSKKKAMTDWEMISLSFSQQLASLNTILVYSAISLVLFFGVTIFAAITAIILLS